MKRIYTLLLLLLPLLLMAQWVPDTLGHGYQMRYIDQGRDYSGKVRSTVIRKLSPCAHGRAILYVHGYNDYFFQREMGDRMVDSCYDFYAVDLRKYGRSILPGQKKFQVRDLKEYFADIDSALAVMKSAGIDDVVLIGHSTGGLITSYYMSQKPDSIVKLLVLNSPFLDWNMNGFMRNVLLPTVAASGKLLPNIAISNGNSTAYAESLLREHHGEWEFNTDWKTFYPQKVTTSWLRAIDKAQGKLHKGGNINVPILLMHSDKSVYGDKWSEQFQHGDAVLNVEHISKYGKRLGANVTEVTIPGGIHDLILSEKPVREKTYQAIFDFINAYQ